MILWTFSCYIFFLFSSAASTPANLTKSIPRKQKLSNITNVNIIIGEVKLYVGVASRLPVNWILCHGQALSRTEYAALFSVIGESFGSGDGKNTFNLPDLRSRFVMGRDPLQVRSSTAANMGQTGGHVDHTLTINHLPVHSHTSGTLEISANGLHRHQIRDRGHKHQFNYGHWNLELGKRYVRVPIDDTDASKDRTAGFTRSSRTNITVENAGNHSHNLLGSTNSIGSGGSFSLLNPYQIMDYIIFAGVNKTISPHAHLKRSFP